MLQLFITGHHPHMLTMGMVTGREVSLRPPGLQPVINVWWANQYDYTSKKAISSPKLGYLVVVTVSVTNHHLQREINSVHYLTLKERDRDSETNSRIQPSCKTYAVTSWFATRTSRGEIKHKRHTESEIGWMDCCMHDHHPTVVDHLIH